MRAWKTAMPLPIPILTLILAMVLASCASLEQGEGEVYIRPSGERLRYWLPVQQAAALHWPYAWASVAAYQDADDPKRRPLQTTPACPEPHELLSSRGWMLWDRLPLLRHPKGDARSADGRMREKHLRAEVWSNSSERKVIIAFGGTAFSSLEDWKSNLHWLLGPLGNEDAYDVLTDVFSPAFQAEYIRRSGETGNAWLKTADLIATGHSLGGGLAQRFAYSLRQTEAVPQVKTVYAFDPSPVSGKRDIPYFPETAKGLVIYRIYNRGESLAGVRSLLKWGNPGDRRHQGQTWVDVRYRSNWTWRTLLPSGTVQAHGMYDLACFMKTRLPAAPVQGQSPPAR